MNLRDRLCAEVACHRCYRCGRVRWPWQLNMGDPNGLPLHTWCDD